MQTQLQAALYRNKYINVYATIDIVGSVAITGQGNDIDLLVLLTDESGFLESTPMRLSTGADLFHSMGYESPETGEETSGGADTDDFNSFRLGEVNILLTDDPAYRERWLAATSLCKELHSRLGIMGDRDIRVLVHQVVVDGNY